MTKWYVAYTQPRGEREAVEHLSRQGFEVFCPQYLKRRSHARRVSMAPTPLFPRYLFVSFDPNDPKWRAIRSTRGIVDLVRNGLDPVQVPDAVMSGIRSREDEDGFIVLARYVNFKCGDRIRIDSGAFTDQEAIFEAMRDEDRVVALLSILGRSVRVEVPIRAVVPCEARASEGPASIEGPREPRRAPAAGAASVAG